MKKLFIAFLGFVIFCSHDMYLKMDTYFVEPNQQARIHLYNGTFEKSENVIDRDRMLGASLTGNGETYEVRENQWSEKDSITVLSFQTGDAGTWVAGVSTKPRNIEMKAEAFNDYLRHDGVLDMIALRRENNTLKDDAVEKYSKHVKAIFQVGDQTSDDWNTVLGYPIEFIPLRNPYEINTGDRLQVKLLLNGQPLPDQLVYADYKATGNGHSHENEDADGAGHSHSGEGEHEHSHEKEDGDGAGHSHSSNEEHGHSHEKGEADGAGHSHANDEEHSHSHEKAADGAGHSHSGEGENGHSHEKTDAENQSHSHATGQEHSHEETDAENHAHSHNNGDDHQHGETPEPAEDHQHTSGQQLRTDQNGILDLNLTADGIWYLRTIHLTTTEEIGLTHESNWATLTFEVTHGHEHGEGADGHTHAAEDEFPSYIFWIGSLVVLGALFFWFSRKGKP